MWPIQSWPIYMELWPIQSCPIYIVMADTVMAYIYSYGPDRASELCGSRIVVEISGGSPKLFFFAKLAARLRGLWRARPRCGARCARMPAPRGGGFTRPASGPKGSGLGPESSPRVFFLGFFLLVVGTRPRSFFRNVEKVMSTADSNIFFARPEI